MQIICEDDELYKEHMWSPNLDLKRKSEKKKRKLTFKAYATSQSPLFSLEVSTTLISNVMQWFCLFLSICKYNFTVYAILYLTSSSQYLWLLFIPYCVKLTMFIFKLLFKISLYKGRKFCHLQQHG